MKSCCQPFQENDNLPSKKTVNQNQEKSKSGHLVTVIKVIKLNGLCHKDVAQNFNNIILEYYIINLLFVFFVFVVNSQIGGISKKKMTLMTMTLMTMFEIVVLGAKSING